MQPWMIWLVALSFACLALFAAVAWMDARDALRRKTADANLWEERARALGWKGAWEQAGDAVDSMRRSTDGLRNVATALAETARVQAEGTEKIRAVNADLQDANVRLRASADGLAAAARKMEAANDALPKPRRPEDGQSQLDPRVKKAIERAEAIARSGKPPDPKSWN